MGAYLARRLVALLPTMLLASLIVFVTIRLIPGDVIDLMLSQNDVAADKMSRDQLVAALGLDQPVWLQYLRWVGAILWMTRTMMLEVLRQDYIRTSRADYDTRVGSLLATVGLLPNSGQRCFRGAAMSYEIRL